jgi:hypothetical protein
MRAWSIDGAVAQLGERLLCKQEVIGSIPFGSTSFLISRERKKIENERRHQALACSLAV